MAERTEIEGHEFILSAPSESGRAYLCQKSTGAMFGIGDKVAANAFHACDGLAPELIDDVLRLLPRVGASSNDGWWTTRSEDRTSRYPQLVSTSWDLRTWLLAEK